MNARAGACRVASPAGDPDVRSPRVSFERCLVLIALVGLALRLAVVLAIPTRPTSDSWSYFQRGANIIHFGRYEALPGSPDANFPPGYPLVLAVTMAVAPTNHALVAVRLLSCGLGFCAVLLIGVLGRRLYGAAMGLTSASLLALYPRHVLQAAVLLSEHLFLPLLLLLLLVLVTAWDRPAAWRLAALAGVLTGLLALVRPIGYLLGILWIGQVLARRRRWRLILAELAFLLAMQHAIMLPWAVRNRVTLGTFSFLSSVGGIDLLIGNNPRASGGWMAWRPILEEMEPAAREPDLGCFAIDGLARKAALRWMSDNPAEALQQYVRRLGRILWEEDFLVFFAITGTDLRPPPNGASALPPGHPAIPLAPTIRTLLTWSYRLLLALAAVACVTAGMRHLRKRPGAPRATLLLIVAAAYFPLVAAVFLASSRFRWPAEELLIVLAAHALLSRPAGSRRFALRPG